MSAITRQPTNRNFLSPLGFRFVLLKAPGVEYFIQSINIPSINLGVANVPTPFVRMPFAGDHLEFGELTISFKIDEDMKNYLEIYNWMIGLGFPDKFDQYKAISNTPTKDGVYSDASLVILTSSKNPNIEVKFKNMFPISLDPIQFDTTQTDVEYVSTTATFKYQSFEVGTVNS
jgi:hypothetical protein